uniref:Uncharacterized protein n=1 Tax=Phakopsora pachyrhizi TaxID=170000 RepID=A0A0S1MK46_PHAPC
MINPLPLTTVKTRGIIARYVPPTSHLIIDVIALPPSIRSIFARPDAKFITQKKLSPLFILIIGTKDEPANWIT